MQSLNFWAEKTTQAGGNNSVIDSKTNVYRSSPKPNVQMSVSLCEQKSKISIQDSWSGSALNLTRWYGQYQNARCFTEFIFFSDKFIKKKLPHKLNDVKDNSGSAPMLKVYCFTHATPPSSMKQKEKKTSQMIIQVHFFHFSLRKWLKQLISWVFDQIITADLQTSKLSLRKKSVLWNHFITLPLWRNIWVQFKTTTTTYRDTQIQRFSHSCDITHPIQCCPAWIISHKSGCAFIVTLERLEMNKRLQAGTFKLI